MDMRSWDLQAIQTPRRQPMWDAPTSLSPPPRLDEEFGGAHGLVPACAKCSLQLDRCPLREVLPALASYDPHGFVLKMHLAREKRSWDL
ncbi:UNVERIFIED_CONTAM: hypothetical protein Slati_1234300 [Sesamum latifolium]|uniref:Uncharacterized protein n=1 Tax=Sesamum latifolium TaxID=2727402 RepID=A0AAW2XEF7_9LAMI